AKQGGEGSEALAAAKHATKASRASRGKVDRQLKSLTAMKRQFSVRAKEKQRDDWRMAGDEHAKNAATATEMQGELMREPSDWS
ncbi:unnamed protein product, partial [Prorocentrum cordatum]